MSESKGMIGFKLKSKVDYPAWSTLMEGTLAGESLMRYVSHTSIKAKPTKISGESTDDYEDRLEVWLAKDSQARTYILRNLSTEIRDNCLTFDSASALWKHLKSHYGSTGAAEEYQLYMDWENTNCDSIEKLDAFCSAYQARLAALQPTALEISKVQAAYRFMNQVSPYVPAWAALKRDAMRLATKEALKQINLSSLVASVLDEKVAHDTEQTQRALIARRNGPPLATVLANRPQQQQPRQNSNAPTNARNTFPSCEHCGRNNHHASKCWDKFPNQKPDFMKKKKEKKNAAAAAAPTAQRAHHTAVEELSDSEEEDVHPGQQRGHRAWLMLPESTVQALHAATSRDEHILDSGTSAHIVNSINNMSDSTPCHIAIGIGKGTVYATRQGTVHLKLAHTGYATFSDTLFVPEMVANLISTEALRRKGVFYRNDTQVLFTKNDGDEDTVAGYIYVKYGLPHLLLDLDIALVAKPLEATADVWHGRLGHIHSRKLAAMKKKGLILISKHRGHHHPRDCIACRLALSKKIYNRLPILRPTEPFTIVAVDVVTVSFLGLGRERYITLLTDLCTLFRHLYLLRKKNSAAKGIRIHRSLILTQYNKRVGIYRIDGGGEHGGHELTALAKEEGFILQVSAPYSSTQNGEAEVSNHIVNTTARKMMVHAGLPRHLWSEAAPTAVYLLNITTSQAVGAVPWELVEQWQGRPNSKAKLSHLRVYGCPAVFLDHSVIRGDKYSATGKTGMLVGYEEAALYRIWVKSENRVYRTKDVKLIETAEDEIVWPMDHEDDAEDIIPFDDIFVVTRNRITEAGGAQARGAVVQPIPDGEEPVIIEEEQEALANEVEGAYNGDLDADLMEVQPKNAGDSSSDDNEPPTGQFDQGNWTSPAPLARGGRERRPNPKYALLSKHARKQQQKLFQSYLVDTGLPRCARRALNSMPHTVISAFIAAVQAEEKEIASEKTKDSEDIKIPKSYAQAMKSPQASHWRKACEAEVGSLDENSTWQLIARHLTGKAIVLKGRWVFTVKRDADGAISRYKARWVVCGYRQVQGIDYDETYAAVVRPASLRILFAIIAHYNLECRQYDITTAFLNAVIDDRQLYVEMPHGFEQPGMVCLLLRALYGLKQSPMLWYRELKKFLETIGFFPALSDVCVFKHANGNVIVIYVDDMLLISHSIAELEHTAALLQDRFKMRKLGELHYYLGMRIIRNRDKRTIHVVQDAYLFRLQEKYSFTGSPPTTPLDHKHNLRKAPKGYQCNKQMLTEYQTAVGEALWPAMVTRADCSYHVGLLSRFLANPTQEHLDSIKRVLHYLVGTAGRGMVFEGSQGDDMDLTGYTDAAWADDQDERRSTSAFCFMMAGALLMWKSGRQPIVTLSSTESEYVALTLAAKEANFLGKLLEELGYKGPIFPIIIYEDNKPAIDITNRTAGAIDGRTKHIQTRYHYIRQEVNNGSIKVEWIGTNEQVADGLTKALDRVKFDRFVKQINLVNCEEVVKAQKRSEKRIQY